MRRSCSFLLPLLFITAVLSGCHSSSQQTQATTVACTTYPVYLLAEALTERVEGVEPVLVIDQQVSCLHDYTLTMRDMKTIESADLLAINGGGMEEFLEDVLESRDYLDCSEGLELAFNEEEGKPDAHLWLSPTFYADMAQNLAEGLCLADPSHADTYQQNAANTVTELEHLQTRLTEELSSLNCRKLITFHDGFGYFAEAFGLEIAASVEEEEGSEASARRIVELTELIDEANIPAVFTEVNGSDSTAVALSYERGTKVAALNLGMSRESVPEELHGLDAYEWVLTQNVETILEAYR